MALSDLVNDPFAEKRYIAEISAYNIAGTATTTIYVSDHGLVSQSSDTPAKTLFESRIIEPIAFDRSMFSKGKIGGRSRTNFGNLILNNADGGLDAMAGYAFDGRSIIIKIGSATDSYSDYTTIFTGTSDSIEFDDLTVKVRLRDKQLLFETPVQGTLYAGSGGTEGGDDLKGKPKPLCFGKVFNISPVRVDATNAIYQVHDGQIEAIDAVYDNGVVVSASDYTADLTNGRFTLDSASTGQITCDIQGAKPSGSYKSTADQIIREIVTTYGGLADSGDLDTASFTALNSANSNVVGLYLDKPAKMQDALDAIANSVGAFYGFARNGKFNVGRVEAPATSADASFTAIELIELERMPTVIPNFRTIVNYQKNFTVQTSDKLNSSATASRRAFVEQEYRTESNTATSVQTAHPEAPTLELNTLLTTQANALTEATRLQTLYGADRDFYKVKLKTQPFTLELNDTVQLTFARYNLTSGKKFRVIGIDEDASQNEIELELWG
tara:strand:+ start:6375 stop:7868 length:1494 start_codon:yes stop_codon:yes gene_type:complete